MEILNAYCLELDQIVDPLEARNAYFSQTDKSLRFNFYCSDENCRIKLIGANIYKPEEAVKRQPYFRTKTKSENPHKDICKYHDSNTKDSKKKNSKQHGIDPVKEHIYPSVLILDRPETVIKIDKSIKNNEIKDEILKEKISVATKKYNKSNHSETIYLEKVVNYYEVNPKCEFLLKIGDTTHQYKNWFKRILYFEDGKDFIFWDFIRKIKKYGNNYSIELQSKCLKDKLSFFIYLKPEVIENYRLKRDIIGRLEYLIDLIDNKKDLNNKERAICYFVKTYPELSTQPFNRYDIPIDNLYHFVIKSIETKK